MRVPVTAIVCSFNEGHLLEKCLPGLWFCDEIVVIDLESDDNTQAVAHKFSCHYVRHKNLGVVERIHEIFVPKAKNEWVLITDPDEVIDISLGKQIVAFFDEAKLSNEIGAVLVPIVFYFKNRPLRGTPWGNQNKRTLLINRHRFYFTGQVHAGRHLKAGYQNYEFEMTGSNVIHHFWMHSYLQLIRKHLRYLYNEGQSRYRIGKRTSIVKIFKEPFAQFRFSYFLKKGFKDGITGIFLSVFWAWYQTSAEIALFRYQNKMNKV